MMNRVYLFAAVKNHEFCLLKETDELALLSLNGQNTILDTNSRLVLNALIAAHPSVVSSQEMDQLFTQITIGNRSHPSKQKLYLLNRTDSELQKLLGLKPPSLARFSAKDRLFLTAHYGKSLSFGDDVVQFIASGSQHPEAFLCLWGLMYQGHLQEARELLNAIHWRSGKWHPLAEAFHEVLLVGQNPTHFSELRALDCSKVISLIYLLVQLSQSGSQPVFGRFYGYLMLYLERLCLFFYQKRGVFHFLNLWIQQPHLFRDPAQHLKVLETLTRLDGAISKNSPASFERQTGNHLFHEKFAQDYINRSCHEPDWHHELITPQEICEIERHADEVWIITSNFLFDTQNTWPEFSKMIHQNIAQGKRYRYFHPPEAASGAEMLRYIYQHFHVDNMPQFHCLEHLAGVFRFLCSEMVLYNPLSAEDSARQGYYLDVFDAMALFGDIHQTFPIVHQRMPVRTVEKMVSWLAGCAERSE